MHCKHCRFWKNEQAELEYSAFYGICVCNKWKFSTTDDADVMVLDRNNRSDKYTGVQRFENTSIEVPIGKVDQSQYCLVTEENFGCIHFEKKKRAIDHHNQSPYKDEP